MKFIVDAQLPFQLAKAMQKSGYDTVHTDDLPNKEQTTDEEIRQISIIENRIVITKDSDFVHSHLISNIPAKILYVTTGNISNKDLSSLFLLYFDKIMEAFDAYDFIELSKSGIIFHE
jgi:predicted nuclease of predicted toxin-antitoxin system